MLVGGLSVCLVSGCTPSQPQSQTPVQTSTNSPAPLVGDTKPTTNSPEPVRSNFERGKLLNRLQERQQAQAAREQANSAPEQEGGGDPWLAQYGQDRLWKASTIRSWAVIPVIPVGIDAFMKTAWAKGNLHIRLAMLGPLQNLQMFLRDHNNLHITFTDASGSNLKQMTILCSSMQQAPSSANGGAPTFQFESDIECPLEVYEQFYQWTFEWD